MVLPTISNDHKTTRRSQQSYYEDEDLNMSRSSSRNSTTQRRRRRRTESNLASSDPQLDEAGSLTGASSTSSLSAIVPQQQEQEQQLSMVEVEQHHSSSSSSRQQQQRSPPWRKTMSWKRHTTWSNNSQRIKNNRYSNYSNKLPTQLLDDDSSAAHRIQSSPSYHRTRTQSESDVAFSESNYNSSNNKGLRLRHRAFSTESWSIMGSNNNNNNHSFTVNNNVAVHSQQHGTETATALLQQEQPQHNYDAEGDQSTVDNVSSIPNDFITEEERNRSHADIDQDIQLGQEDSLERTDVVDEQRPSSTLSSRLPPPPPPGPDPHSDARRRWLLINHRFQLVVTVVALMFSLLLFAILVCWVVLAVTYFLTAFDQPCDLPLRAYFWFVTIQLFLDVFRTDILKYCFRWDPSGVERTPLRVVLYNLCYLMYAALILRLGIMSVFMPPEESTCQQTAPALFRACAAFVSLSLAAWGLIVFGYVFPMFATAALLTWNGYHPTYNDTIHGGDTPQAMFLPTMYARTGAPPGFIDELPTISYNELAGNNYTRECCICMENFEENDGIVKTVCNHVFHQACFREWLGHARTCPVCRTDLCGESQGQSSHQLPETPTRIPFGPTGRPVAHMMRIFSRSEADANSNSRELPPPTMSTSAATRTEPAPIRDPLELEDGNGG